MFEQEILNNHVLSSLDATYEQAGTARVVVNQKQLSLNQFL